MTVDVERLAHALEIEMRAYAQACRLIEGLHGRGARKEAHLKEQFGAGRVSGYTSALMDVLGPSEANVVWKRAHQLYEEHQANRGE